MWNKSSFSHPVNCDLCHLKLCFHFCNFKFWFFPDNQIMTRVSVFLVLVLIQSLLLESLKINAGISTSSSSIMIALNLHVKLFPSRNTRGFSRTSPATHCPLSHKITQSLYIARVSLAAYYLVLLSGDVNPNPGPISDSHNIGLPRALGLKLAHLNA